MQTASAGYCARRRGPEGWLQEKLKQGGNLGQTILIWAPKGLALGLLGLSYLKLVTSSFNPFIYFQF